MNTESHELKHEHTQQTLFALERIIAKADMADRKELIALHDRITLCNDKTNSWQIPDAINFTTGEEYNARGKYWSCNSKLCAGCVADSSRRARKALSTRISTQVFRKSHKFYFPTLTIKNPGLPLSDTRSIINRAWTLLRKRRFWCDSIFGGFKSEEFTLTANGYHYHIHLLIQSRFILFNEFRRVWTECVQKAFDEAGIELTIATSDKMLIVRFEKVTNIERIPFELCKYVTKTDSWSKIPSNDLKCVALTRRWHRTREFFGTWKNDQIETNAKREPILDKSDLSDAAVSGVANEDEWRDRVWRIGNVEYRKQLLEEFRKAKDFRIMQLRLRWKHASIDQTTMQNRTPFAKIE